MHFGDHADTLPLQIAHDLRVVDDIAEHADGFPLVGELIDHFDCAADAEAEAHFVRQENFHTARRPLLVASMPATRRCVAVTKYTPARPRPPPDTGGVTRCDAVALPTSHDISIAAPPS